MVLDIISQYISNIITFLFGGFEAEVISLVLYTIGMFIYGIIIWNYYRHLARRDIFKIDFSKYRKDTGKYVWLKKFFDGFFYILQYIIIFPLFTFIWFAVLSFFLLFLAKTQSVENILLASITIVSAVRATAYYSEDLSKDLAKMIPFALLGVFIIDPSFFSISIVWERLVSIPSFVQLVGRYLLFVVLLEFGLRILHSFAGLVKSFMRKDKPEKSKIEPPQKVIASEEKKE